MKHFVCKTHPEKHWIVEDWRMTGLDGGGHASVNLWTHFSGRVLVGHSATANLTPEKARALGALLIEVAERAEAETDTLSWDESGACNPPFILRPVKKGGDSNETGGQA